MARVATGADHGAHMKIWRPTHSKPRPAGVQFTRSRSLLRAPLSQVGLATLAGLLLIPACQRTHTRKEMVSPNEVGGAALHAVHSERLKGIMTALQGLAFERLPQELDTASRQRAELKEAAAVAADLVRSASQIPGVADEITLTAEERKVFLALAEQLRGQAQKLDAEANKGAARSVEATMQEITGTCIACHALFREASPAANSAKP